MFGRKHRKPSTVHCEWRRDYFASEDGTLHPDIPLATGSAVELEVRYVVAWLLRHFAAHLSAQPATDQRPQQNDQIIDVAFGSDLQSGSS